MHRHVQKKMGPLLPELVKKRVVDTETKTGKIVKKKAFLAKESLLLK